MTSSPNIVTQPPLTNPVLDASGKFDRAWGIWFRDVYKRVAYKGGNAIDDNLISIEQLEKDLAALAILVGENADNILINAVKIAQNTIDIAKNTLDIAANLALINQNIADIDNLESLLFSNYSLTANRTTEANEIIITNGFNVTLNATPKDSERVYIKINGSTQLIIDGNGKTIDGSAQLSRFRAYQTVMVVHDATAGAWFII